MPKCRHGNYTTRVRDLNRAEDRLAEKHRRKTGCTAEVFGHPGTILGIFSVICCTKHGQVS